MDGLIGFVVAVLCGFVPMFFLAAILYWLDRYEKEPVPLLGGVFGWGAVIAILGALALQLSLNQGIRMLTGSQALEEIVGASLFAPITEELLKGLAVLGIFLLFPHEFDSILDGIVYAGIAALGFAATEDVLYYFSSYLENGYAGMFSLVFLRFVIFGWQHAFFTAFIGIGLALARTQRSPLIRLGAPLVGFTLAVFLHGVHNALLIFLNNLAGLTIAALVAWTGWLLMLGFILWQINTEKNWLRAYLLDELEQQTITPEQYRIACQPFGQSKARFRALLRGRYRQTVRFYQTCAELSHKKRQLALMGEEQDNSQRVDFLRKHLLDLSRELD